MLKKIIPTLLFLLSCSVYSIDNVLVDELEYLGASEESWMAVGIRNSIINDLSGIGGKYDLNIITVKEQTEAMQSLNERRKTGEKINLAKELERLLNIKYRCNGSIQNSKGVIRVTVKILKSPSFTIWKSTVTDKKRAEILSLQNEIVFNLMNGFDKKISVDEQSKISQNKPKNETAYELYSKGNQLKSTNPSEAVKFYEKAIEADDNYFIPLVEASELLVFPLRDLSKAEKFLKKAESILLDQGIQNTEEYAYLLFVIGRFYSESREDHSDGGYYTKSKELYESLNLQKSKRYAVVISHLGMLKWNIELLKESLIILEKIGQRNSIEYFRALMALTNYYQKQKLQDREAIRDGFQKLTALIDTLGLKQTSLHSQLLLNIGAFYNDFKKSDFAIEHLNKSLLIKEKLQLENTEGYIYVMLNLGNAYSEKGQKEKALSYYKKCKEISDNLGFKDESYYPFVLESIKTLSK